MLTVEIFGMCAPSAPAAVTLSAFHLVFGCFYRLFVILRIPYLTQIQKRDDAFLALFGEFLSLTAILLPSSPSYRRECTINEKSSPRRIFVRAVKKYPPSDFWACRRRKRYGGKKSVVIHVRFINANIRRFSAERRLRSLCRSPRAVLQVPQQSSDRNSVPAVFGNDEYHKHDVRDDEHR